MSDWDKEKNSHVTRAEEAGDKPGKEKPDVEMPDPGQEPGPIQPPAPPEYTPDPAPPGFPQPEPVETPPPQQPPELPPHDPGHTTPDSPPAPPEISPPPANYRVGALSRSNVIDFGRYYRMAQRRRAGDAPLIA